MRKTIWQAIRSFVAAALILCLASCGAVEPLGVISAADKELDSGAYTVKTKVDFTSGDTELASAISELSNESVMVVVGKDNFKAKLTAVCGNDKLESTYVALDGILYLENRLENDKGVFTTKVKSPLTDAEKNKAAVALGDGAVIDFTDFSTLGVTGGLGSKTVTATEIKDEALDSLVSLMRGKLSGLNATVAIKDVELTAKITGVRYDTVTLVCAYVITVGSDVYTVRMTRTSTYTYTVEEGVVAPLDASEYTEAPLS